MRSVLLFGVSLTLAACADSRAMDAAQTAAAPNDAPAADAAIASDSTRAVDAASSPVLDQDASRGASPGKDAASTPPPADDAGSDSSAQSKAETGSACVQDSDCDSGFCDRDRCATPTSVGGGYIGGNCLQNHDFDSKAGGGCRELACIEGRCRRCLGDSECDPVDRCDDQGRCVPR